MVDERLVTRRMPYAPTGHLLAVLPASVGVPTHADTSEGAFRVSVRSFVRPLKRTEIFVADFSHADVKATASFRR
ncbi:unnamed protein product, partial [Rangifer tarandus platyrhynchus]